jgi:hypothetical protein
LKKLYQTSSSALPLQVVVGAISGVVGILEGSYSPCLDVPLKGMQVAAMAMEVACAQL